MDNKKVELDAEATGKAIRELVVGDHDRRQAAAAEYDKKVMDQQKDLDKMSLQQRVRNQVLPVRHEGDTAAQNVNSGGVMGTIAKGTAAAVAAVPLSDKALGMARSAAGFARDLPGVGMMMDGEYSPWIKAFGSNIPYVGKVIGYSSVAENGLRAMDALTKGDGDGAKNELTQLAIRGAGAWLNQQYGNGVIGGVALGLVQVMTEKWADNVRNERARLNPPDAPAIADKQKDAAAEAPKAPGEGAANNMSIDNIKKRLTELAPPQKPRNNSTLEEIADTSMCAPKPR